MIDDYPDADNLLAHAIEELAAFEKKYSRFDPKSLISRINARAGNPEPLILDDEAQGLFQFCDALWHETNGLFDISSGGLARLWDFKTGRVPTEDEIQAALSAVGWANVDFTGNIIALPTPNMALDLGGVGKEYAVDLIARTFLDAGVEHALIDLSGDIRVLGTQGDGTPWRIGLRTSRRADTEMTLTLRNTAVASSGNYERSITIEDKTYSHFLSPETGRPVEGPTAVTVIAEQCLIAGAISTVACLKPLPDAKEWLAASGLPWLMCDISGNMEGPIADALSGLAK